MNDKSSKALNIIFYILLILTIICFLYFIKLTIFADYNNEKVKEPKVPEQKEDEKINSKIVISFKDNGSIVSKKTLVCYNVTECTIEMPSASRTNGNFLGYSLDKNAKKASYLVGNNYSFKEDTTLYAISSKTYYLTIEKGNATYISSNKVSCTFYNQESNCRVVVPQYNVPGYESKGYSESKNSKVGYIYPGRNYTLNKNVAIYPIYNTSSRGMVIPVRMNKTIANWVFDVDNECPDTIANTYFNYFDKISKKAPYLALYSKITFLGDTYFNKIHGSNYVGMTYGLESLKMFDVRCSNSLNNDYYATIVHEMTHVWDFYYGDVMGTAISSQSDIVSLFNKYSNMSNRPFRDYSYTNRYEFVADLIRYYYLKYTDPQYYYSTLEYPSDIKTVIEKYICIAKNNYNASKCK